MLNQKKFTRRDFLNLSGLGLVGLFGPNLNPLMNLYQDQQGRVIYENISTHKKPTYDSEKVRIHWKDAVFPITSVVLGSDDPSHNRIWYKVGTEGYAHSGAIQPVRTDVNPVYYDFPPEGALAEVTVPYTDALWTPGERYHVAYRFITKPLIGSKMWSRDLTASPIITFWKINGISIITFQLLISGSSRPMS